MKKLNVLTRMLLLVALLVGSTSSVWADVIESNFTDKDCHVGTGELQWTGTNTTSFESSGSARGVQSNKNITAMVFTSNASQTATLGTITKVVVTASANADRDMTVTIGDNAFGSAQTVRNGSTYANTDYTFTGSASGTIVVSIAPSGSKSTCWIKKIVVTYNASKEPSISAEDIELEGSDTSGEISYSIANAVDGASVVPTCDDEWISNFSVNAGTKKVTFDVEENTGAPREGTVTLTYKKDEDVYDAVAVKVTQGGFINYTLATQVVPGRHYIITNGTNGTIKAMGKQNDNNRAAVNISATLGEASVSTSAGVYEFVISGDMTTGYYTIYDVENSKYLYAASSSSNHLKIQDNIDANSRWTIEINGGTGVATIKAKDSSNRNWMRNNGTIFSCYTSDQSDIYLFERDGDTSVQNADVSIAANKEWITYCCPFALDFSEDIEGLEGAYTISSHISGATTLTATKMNGMVKAGTGLLLHAANVDADNAQAIAIKMAGTGVEQSGNMLKGVIVDTAITPTDGDYTNLGLKNGSFVPYSAEGTIAARKAYLQIPTADMPTAGAKLSIVFDEEGTEPSSETDGINAVVNTVENGVRYNLAGQKVGADYKGIVIVNGKKVIRK